MPALFFFLHLFVETSACIHLAISVTNFQKGETLRCKQTEFLSESYKANKTDSKTPSIITKFRKYVVLQAKNKRANQQHQSKQTKLSFRPCVFTQSRGANVVFSASSDVYLETLNFRYNLVNFNLTILKMDQNVCF